MIIPGGVTSSTMGPLGPRGGWMSAPFDHWDRSRLARRQGSEQLVIFDVFLILGAAGTIARFAPILPWVGRLTAGTGSRARDAWHVSGFIKRPIHSTMALRALSRPGSRLSGPIMRSLRWRKRGNMALLSLAAVNPLENVYYIQKGDWTRLFINYHLPFVGVPIWNQYNSTGGGEPSEIPNFHRPPPSLEEAGAFMSEPLVAVEIEESPRRSTSKKSRYCPRGYYWDRSRRKCMPLEGPNDYRRFKRRYRKKG